MTLVKLFAGLCALLLGHRVFWLFVGVVGFVFGAEMATRFFREQPRAVVLMIALTGGLVGAVLAYWMQEFMIGVVGFLAGSYVAVQLLIAAMPYPGRMIWFALFIGGALGALLAFTLFDWALIVLSSLIGAGLIVEALGSGVQAEPFVFVVLTALGIAAQASVKRWPRRSPGS
jgi:hypothetical protein